MKCSQCKKEADKIITFIDQKTRKSKYICDSCLLAASPMINNIDELDREIKEVEANMKKLATMIDGGKEPDLSGTDKGLSALLFTPSKIFQIYLRHYNNLVDNKQRLLGSMKKKERLLYDLKKAIEEENYERAAELRDKISQSNQSL